MRHFWISRHTIKKQRYQSNINTTNQKAPIQDFLPEVTLKRPLAFLIDSSWLSQLRPDSDPPVDIKSCAKILGDEIYRFPLILRLNTPEHLKVTTRLGFSIISSAVWGFRPFRSRLFLTQNFPNPLIRTSSPFSNLLLRISKRDSTTSTELFLGMSSCV